MRPSDLFVFFRFTADNKAACHMHLVLAITSIYLCTPFNRFICIANRYHVHHYPWALIYFIRFRHLSFAFSLMPLLVCNSDCNAIKMHPNKNRDNVSLIC